MKLETNVTERVTKSEKVLTISESEYEDIVESVAKDVIADRVHKNVDSIIDLVITMETAIFAGKLHKALFNSEEE